MSCPQQMDKSEGRDRHCLTFLGGGICYLIDGPGQEIIGSCKLTKLFDFVVLTLGPTILILLE